MDTSGSVIAEPAAAELKELLRQRESLRQVIESISGELELRPLLTQIVRAACELLPAEMGLIGLVSANGQAIRIEAVYGKPLVELGLVVLPGEGLAGQVLLSGQPLILERYDELESPLLPELANYAVIGVPVRWRGPMIGFFGLGAAPPRRFDQQDTEILLLLARHAAIAIENARLYETEKRRANHIAIINRIGRLVNSSLNLDQLLQTTVEAMTEYLHYPHIAILLIDPARLDTLVLRAGSGIYAAPENNPYEQRIDQGIIGTAARTRRRRLVNNVQLDLHYLLLPGGENIYAELAVPIVVSDRLLGVLNIDSEEQISEEDAESFGMIADQLGVAMDNARLFAEVRGTLDQTRLLYETSQRISTAMGVDEVIRVYLEQVAVRGRYACHIVLYEFDDIGQRMAARVRGRWTPEEGLVLYLADYLPNPSHPLDPFLDAGQTVAIADAYGDNRVPVGLRQLLARFQRQSLALIPLVAGGQRIGLVILSHPSVHTWPENDLQPYQTTAAQLATAIDHRQQYRLLYERGRQIAVLQERQRLARELHDSVTQLIFSMTLIAQSIGPAWRRNPTEGERRIDRLLELSQSALAEMRALLAELRLAEPTPPVTGQEPEVVLTDAPPIPRILKIQQEGLVAVLGQHLADVARDGLAIDFDPAGYVPQQPEQEEALYRITQEALNNVVKHARASRVRVLLTMDGQAACLSVSDDGIGFIAPTVEPQQAADGGLGLRSMHERAAMLGGTARVTAAPGGGTIVAVVIPRKDRAT